MATISSCPKCQKPVSVPTRIEPAALVRCPLCAAEYPLAEALPPELIPVAIVADAAPAAEGAVALGGAIEHEPAVEGREEEERKNTFGHEEMAIEHEENEAAAVAMGQSRRDTMAAVRGRQPSPVSGVMRAIHVVSGGLAGCLLAYYLVAIWFGPEFKKLGFPELPLPGIAWLTTAPVKPDATGEKHATEPSAPAKPGNDVTSHEASDANKTPAKKASPSPSGRSAKTP